jgi:ADP-heptose:LPS heptosyltransferase
MSQREILPFVEKFYPVKIFVKTFIWCYCKIARLRSLFKKSDINRVCVISLHKIGDSIFTIHAIKKISEYYEDKSISLICFPETKSIFQMTFPSIEIVTIPHSYFWKNRIANHSAKKILNKIGGEIIYDLTGTIASATLIASSYSKKIIGMNLEYFKPLYDHYSLLRKTPHLIDMYMDVLKMAIPVEDDLTLEFVFVASKSNKILIHPHAGWQAKEWGIKKYYELAQRLASQYEVEFITEVNSLRDDIKKKIQENYILTETLSVEGLIENIKKCSVFIGNDSGPIYIANLLGKPTFTIYGPTNPEYSKPFGKHHAEIHEIISCSPINTQYCFTDAGRKCPKYVCMHNLSIDKVYNKLVDFLIKENIPHRL